MSIRSFIAILLAFAGLSLFWSCREADEDPDQYLNLALNASYADYDTVSIRLMEAADTTKELELVWNDKIPDPAKFPKYKLKAAKGKDFIIQIRCYNAKHELLLAKDVKVIAKQPNPAVVVVPELRLLGLKLSTGELVPSFSPGTYSYTVKLGEDDAVIAFTATALDAGNALSVSGASANWGVAVSKDLRIGPNVLILTVSTKDGKKSRSYEVTVTRGKVVPPEDVTGISLPDTALTMYTGDTPTTLIATVDPPGAFMEWSSQYANVARVDGAGKVEPVGPGDTKVTVKAGNFSASVNIKVKRDVPIISVGDNIAIKPGTEVAFNISITQEHGTFVSFKYDLDGDTTWDNTDTATVPATQTLKYTYQKIGIFTARFEVKDSEGNTATASRTITVDNSAFQLAIISPKLDTLIKTRSILVKYSVNGTLLEKTFSNLPEGTSPVTVDTGNGADKRSETRQITVDTKAPVVPVFTGTATSTSLKPTWSWKSGGEGNGKFRASLDSAGLSVAAEGIAANYAPGTNLIPGDHILWVQERDEAGNWSEPGKFKITIKTVDTTPPNKTIISGTSPTPTVPKWSWTSGGGGIGIYKHKVGDSTLAGAAEIKDTVWSLTEAPVANRVYILYVSERDSAELWSKPAGHPISYEPGKPGVVILAPKQSGTLYTREASLPFSGTAGGDNDIFKVSYKINGIAAADAQFDKPSWSIASVPFSEGSPTIVTIIARDKLEQTGEATLTVLRDTTRPGLPTITTTPLTPTKATKGSWAWSAGTDGTTGSGVNGNYRHSLDGATWTETTELLVNDVPLKEGTNTFYLQEQDKAGNWSNSATRTVVSDITGPALAISTPANNATVGSIHVTLTGTVSDGHTSVASVVVTGQESGTGAVTPVGGSWTSGDLVLRNSGLDTLTVTATDAVGNPSVKTVILNVSVAANSILITYPAEGMFYNKDSITVRYKVNGAMAELTTHFPSLTTEGNISLEVESPANEAGQITKKTVIIFRDVTPPNQPFLLAKKSPTNDFPEWNWTDASDNANGSGLASPKAFRYQLGGVGAFTNIGTNAYTHTAAVDGTTYSLIVQVMDKAGNWSTNGASSSIPIRVDKTKPVVTITSPYDGFVTSAQSVVRKCTATGASPIQPPDSSKVLAPGPNTITCAVTDSAGNLGIHSITVHHVPNTLFAAPGGAGNGASWDSPLSLETALKTAPSGTSIWATAGIYAATNADSGFILRSGISLYGGFKTDGKAKAITDRVFGTADTTHLANPSNTGSVITLPGIAALNVLNVTVSGVKIVTNQEGQYGIHLEYANNVTFRKIFMFAKSDPTNSGIYAFNANFAVDSSTFTSFSHEHFTINASSTTGSIMSVSNSVFKGNVWFFGSGMDIGNYKTATFTNVWFLDSYTAASGLTHLGFHNNSGTLVLKGCVFRATSQAGAISIGSAATDITTTTFTTTPPAHPFF